MLSHFVFDQTTQATSLAMDVFDSLFIPERNLWPFRQAPNALQLCTNGQLPPNSCGHNVFSTTPAFMYFLPLLRAEYPDPYSPSPMTPPTTYPSAQTAPPQAAAHEKQELSEEAEIRVV
jgi:hypothetical protein